MFPPVLFSCKVITCDCINLKSLTFYATKINQVIRNNSALLAEGINVGCSFTGLLTEKLIRFPRFWPNL